MSENESSGAKIKRVMLDNGQLVVTGTRNLEYELVVSLNHETAKKIMETAGIDKTNPNYKAYYAQAMAAAHHSRRFNGDEEAMIKLFAKEMQKPDMTPEKLKNFERSYRNYILEQQQKHASGSTFDDRDESAQTINKNIQETVRSGVELRKKINPTFPDIMYDNGLLTDVVLDLSSEARETSALGIINSTVDKYNKYGMIFDAESNQFQVKGKPVNVQKFYSSKKNQMDKFLANLEKNGGFDASDKELFEVIEAGDYQKFLELKKQRGGQDKRNMFLRNALNDEILFDRFSEEIKGKEHSLDNVTETAKILSEDYGSKSDIISKESERGKITSATTGDLKAGEIDRIVFSAKPFQVASQSTYQNWKSCMNAVGLNHHYVDDSIGQGSIVAYGYNSKNPQNKISRLLIHPWINEKGETLYVVNSRIYGESNSAFQNSVKAFTESLNQGKKGLFKFNANAFPGATGLYDDNLGEKVILKYMPGDDLDFSQTKKLGLKNVDLSQANSVKFPENVVLQNVKVGKDLDFSQIKNLKLSNVDLSQCNSVNFPENVELEKVKLGNNFDFSQIKKLELKDVDLSQAKSVKFPENVVLQNVKLGKDFDFSQTNSLYLNEIDLSQVETIKFPKNVEFRHGENINKLGPNVDFSSTENLELKNVDLSKTKSVKFPENVKLSSNIQLGDNVDFRQIKNLEISNADLAKYEDIKFPENVKLDMVTLGNNVDFSQIKNLELSNVDLSEANNVKFPENVKFGYGNKFGGNLDFSNVKNLDLSNTDLSKTKSVKFPENVKFDFGTKFGGNLDFSNVKNLDLSNTDLSKTKSVKFPENVKLSMVKLGDNVDFSQIKNLELRNIDLSKAKAIKFPENVKLDMGTLGDNVDFSNVKNLDLSYVDLSKTEAIKFPENVKLSMVTLGNNVDFSQIKNLELSNVDLSEVKSVKFPENAKFGYGNKLGGNLDFSNIKNLDLSSTDLSKATNIRFPENVKFGYSTKLGGNLDFSNIKNLDLSGTDLSKAEAITFPENVKFNLDTKLRGNLDFSNIKNLDLSSVDLSEAKSIKFPENVKLGYGTNLNDNIDLSSVKNIEIPDLSYIDKFNISNDTNIKLGRDVEIRKKDDLNTLKRCDTSETKTIFFDEKILSEVKNAGMEFPSNKVLIFERDGKAVIVCDEKSRNELIKDFQIEENKIDFISPEEFSQKEGVKFEKTDNRASNDNGTKQQETIAKENTNQIEAETEKLMANKQANENTSDLKKTLKQQADKNVEVQSKTTSNLKETLQTQAKSNGSLGSKISAVSNGVDNALEKAGNKLNDNALGRAINKADSWRPHNKTAAKVMDKVGAVPVAAVVASGVSAYEQYKGGDKKGAAATFGKGVVHASVQGVATSAGMNIAAKGASKAAEKVTEKVVARQAAKAASKQVAKAAGKAAGKAVGKSVLKKIPLVSLGAGAYFAYERAKNGEWGKAGCELLSGALGCFPGVGTVASTAVDCGLAVADTKQAINETKKQQAQQQRQAQKSPEQIKQEQKKKAEMAKKAEELRNTKVGQKKAANTNNKTIEKGLLSRIKDAVFSR